MVLAILDGLARFLHVAAVIVWIGHNWANVISSPRYRPILPEDPPEITRDVLTAAMRREHAMFRHASLVALVTGIFMLWYHGLLGDALSLRGQAAPIGIGVWLGLLMIANLWFVLWPHQKKVLGFVSVPTAERLRCTRITFLSSRTNTILSIPTAFFMVMGSHVGFAF